MDLVLKRYGNLNYIENTDWQTAIEIINTAYEKENEETVFRMWLSLFPNMDDESFISFEDYKTKILGAKITTDKSEDEILKEVLSIRKKLGGSKNGS